MRCVFPIVALFAVITPFVYAQPKELTKYEYAVQAFGALEKTEREKRRVKTTYIYEKGAAVGDTISQTVEYEPRMNEYSVTIRKTATGTKREEVIRAEGRIFSNAGNGKWREMKFGSTTPTTTGVGSMAGSGGVSKEELWTEVYRSIGTDVIDGQEMQVIESVKTIVETMASSKRTSEFSQRLWIQRDGRIMKEELLAREDGRTWSHTVSIFEYDPKITIGVPIRSARPRK